MDGVAQALGMAFAMGWEILWPLILGFLLSAAVQAVVSHREMSRLLPDDRPRHCHRPGARHRVLFVFLRGGGPRPLFVPRAQISPQQWLSNWLPPIWSLNSPSSC